MHRILIDIIFLLLVYLLPWWFSLIILLALLFYFSEPPFLEGIVFGFLLDLLYGGGTLNFPKSIIFTTVSLVMFIIILLLKKRLRFY